jgi:hypothetical protein
MQEKTNVKLLVAPCNHEAAKYAVMNWHYSKRMPLFKQSYIGVWENDRFIGCVIFGRSVTPYLQSAFGIKTTQCIELTRVALSKHLTPVTKIISISIGLIRKQNPKLRLIVSYADSNVGHLGVIYQAGNWVFMGMSSKVKQFFWRGSWRNDTSMFNYFKAHRKEKGKCKTRLLESKYKYLYPLDKAMRKQIESLRKPYPKRPDSEKVSRSASSRE